MEWYGEWLDCKAMAQNQRYPMVAIGRGFAIGNPKIHWLIINFPIQIVGIRYSSLSALHIPNTYPITVA